MDTDAIRQRALANGVDDAAANPPTYRELCEYVQSVDLALTTVFRMKGEDYFRVGLGELGQVLTATNLRRHGGRELSIRAGVALSFMDDED